MKAFLLAAGLGTRLKPLTNNKPKALVEINGVPLIEITIKKLIDAGISSIIVNVHHFADQIKIFLESKNNFGIEINISDESDLLLDTGGGLKKAVPFFENEKSFLVHNVDILTDFPLNKLFDAHNTSGKIAALAVQKRESSRYFLFDEEKNLCGWQNVKTNETKITRNPEGKLTQFAFSGIHTANSSILKLMPEQKVFSLVDFFLNIASQNQITYFDHTGSTFIDLGKKENLLKAEHILKT